MRIALLALCLAALAPEARAQLLQGADRVVFVSGSCSSLIVAGKESLGGCQDRVATVRYSDKRRATIFFAGASEAGAYERVSFVGSGQGDPGSVNAVSYRSTTSDKDVTTSAVGRCNNEISDGGLNVKMRCEATSEDGKHFAGEFSFRTSPNNSYAIID